MTLGSFIAALELASARAAAEEIKTPHVEFDFCNTTPTSFASWRGVYSQLALGWADHDLLGHYRDLEFLLQSARAAYSVTFNGWKGGQYEMGSDTLLWVDKPGECSHTAIVGVHYSGGRVVIETMKTE